LHNGSRATRLEGANTAQTMSVGSQKLEEWLARCRWLKSTRLDENTRDRLNRLIADLERDIEDQRDFENRYNGRFG
jgi:hypothetical protein